MLRRTALLIAAAFALSAASAKSAENLRVLPDKVEGIAPSEMMYSYLTALAEKASDRRSKRLEKIKTIEAAKAYQKRMREFFVRQLGGFPKRTPLNPKIVGRIDRDGYRVEKVIFESWPRHYVTALFYLPEGRPPFPGVLVPCGHSRNGKAYDLYQRASIFLAKEGIAALCYDPIGQGERYQILDDSGRPRFGSTLEHTLVGVGSILLGTNTARYRIWDGMRALDYLVSRNEVDPRRIGCTGNSGGGTLTSYLMALDPRIKCAAPSCYLTNFRRLIETIGPQDAEQNIFGQVAFGLDHGDYVMMRAPNPTLICCATRDFFDIRGTWETFREAKRFYTRFGCPERVDLVETDATHGFSPLLRLGMTRWMLRWLRGVDRPVSEPDFDVMEEKQIQCTPRGQAMLLPGARSVFDINAELEKKYSADRRRFWSKTPKKAALEKVRETAGIRPLRALPRPEVRRVGETIRRKNYRIEKIVLVPEKGIWLPALVFHPPEPDENVYLYVNGAGKEADAAVGGPIEKLVRQGHVVFAVDIRGCGETRGRKGGKGWSPYFGTDWKEYFLAYLLGKSYVGMRAEDILVCARFLAEYRPEAGERRIHLVAIGEAGPAALHAAALEPELFDSVRLERSLVSWDNVVRTPVTRNQLINTVHSALKFYDLPDLLATLPKGKVTVVEPVDATGKVIKR